jgi:predicted HTH transcriptional regulator
VATRAYELARERGGTIPYTVVREVVENLIHARFSEVVVSILDDGATMRFSDHGPGIEDKDRSLAPGFSTATQEMKTVIRGVGSGLPIVRDYLAFSGGYVTIEDNLGSGTVITLRLEDDQTPRHEDEPAPDSPSPSKLMTRQKRVLSLAMELGNIGPSAVQRELDIALSTAYRDLAFLEEEGLLRSDGQGKRSLTDAGVSYLDSLFAG